MPGRLLFPFPIPLNVWLFWFSTVRCCGCFFPHNCMYILWFLAALLSARRGILTRIVFFPHRRCRATLRIESEGVWCRRPLCCLHQTTLYDNIVGWNRFVVTFSFRVGRLVSILCYLHHLNPSRFTYTFPRDPVELSVDFLAD